jgi:RNA polymerase sigma-70 factor (sigma-E family)
VEDNAKRATPSRDEAAALLWHRHHASLTRLAASMSGDVALAEEIVQDAFATLLRRWRVMRDPHDAYAYLQRVVINSTRAAWRRNKRMADTTALLARNLWEGGGAADADIHLDLIAALGRLPHRKRACVVLRYYADLSEPETAAILNISVGTVKSQTAKGLRQLAVVLDQERSVAQ